MRQMRNMTRAIAIAAFALTLTACGPRDKPAGTSADPVEVCERVADVCRIDRARLGVCIRKYRGEGFACVSQH